MQQPFEIAAEELPDSVAIVSDGLANSGGAGGAERVLEVFHELFSKAPVFTTVYNPKRMPAHYRDWDIRPSFVQRLPFASTRYNLYLALMPMAVEAFDLSQYQLVLSSNFSVAKGIVPHPEALHICYCHTPVRYAWEFYHVYRERERFPWWQRIPMPLLIHYLKLWDVASADRVDHFIANSQHTARRIAKRYRRQATIIYPPVDTEFFASSHGKREDFFLAVSRMVSYKRLDVAIQAFNELGLPLLVIGDGTERSSLEAMARSNITFLGRVSDEELRDYYTRCRALVFTSEEDCGIVPIEAQATGAPVIAYGAGGATETVEGGITGLFFHPQTAEALAHAVQNFDPTWYDPARIREHARRYDTAVFKDKIVACILKEHRQQHEVLAEGPEWGITGRIPVAGRARADYFKEA